MFQRANLTIAFTSPEYAIVKEIEEYSVYMRKSVVAQNLVCTDSPRCRPNSVIAYKLPIELSQFKINNFII